MKFDKEKIKTYLEEAKKLFFHNNGWIPVLYGAIASLLISPLASTIGSTIGGLLQKSVGFISSYDVKYMIGRIPGSIMASAVSAVCTVSIIGGLIYVIKNNSKIGIPEFVNVGKSLCEKYYREMAILLVAPIVVVEVVGKCAFDLLSDFIIYDLLYEVGSFSATGILGSLTSSSVILLITTAIYSGINLWVDLHFTSKFITEMEEVNISRVNREFLFSTVKSLAIWYTLLSLVPVLGGLVAAIVTFGFTYLFNEFVLMLDDGLRQSSTAAYNANSNQRPARTNNGGDIFAPSQRVNYNQSNGMNNYNQYGNQQQNSFGAGYQSSPISDTRYNGYNNMNNQARENNQMRLQAQSQLPKFCGNCGVQVSVQNKFCPNCGNSIS